MPEWPGGAVVADLSAPALVFGVHGAAGLTRWKCLASGADLHGSWEAIEWASVPPGGLSGEHQNTRTEEIRFLLDGVGELLLNGESCPVRAGSLVLTGIGAVHGLRNVGRDDLNWLVIEMRAPRPRPRRTRTSSKGVTVNARIHDLRTERVVDPAGVFTGPLRRVEIVPLEPGERRSWRATGAEHTFFVLSGRGHAISKAVRMPLERGTAVTLPLGTSLLLTAGDGGLEVFHAALGVTVAGQAGAGQPGAGR